MTSLYHPHNNRLDKEIMEIVSPGLELVSSGPPEWDEGAEDKTVRGLKEAKTGLWEQSSQDPGSNRNRVPGPVLTTIQ